MADSLPKVRNIPIAQMVFQLNSVQAFSKWKDFSLPNRAYFLNWLRHGLHLCLKIQKFSNTFKMSRFTIVYNPLLALTFVVVYWSIGLHHTYSLWTRYMFKFIFIENMTYPGSYGLHGVAYTTHIPFEQSCTVQLFLWNSYISHSDKHVNHMHP